MTPTTTAITCDRETWCTHCTDWIEPQAPHFQNRGYTLCNECESARHVLGQCPNCGAFGVLMPVADDAEKRKAEYVAKATAFVAPEAPAE